MPPTRGFTPFSRATGLLRPHRRPYIKGDRTPGQAPRGGVTYFGQKGNLAASCSAGVYPRLPVTSRTLTLHNRGGMPSKGGCSFTLEPVLSTQGNMGPPAFSKLFWSLTTGAGEPGGHRPPAACATGKGEPLTAGLLEEFPYELECKQGKT